MKVVYTGHDNILLADYNGKRYGFRKNIPLDVPQEVFNHIMSSGNSESFYMRVVEEKPEDIVKDQVIVSIEKEPVIEEEPEEEPEVEVEKPKKRGRKKKS